MKIKKSILKNIIKEVINEQTNSKNKITTKFGVDAGNVCIADSNFIKSNGGSWNLTTQRMCKKIKVKPGTYSIECDIDTYLGDKVEYVKLKVPSGEIWIGDICYYWEDDDSWLKFLNKTSHLEKLDSMGQKCIRTGGDGVFKTIITWDQLD